MSGSEIPKVIDLTSENPRFIRTDELSAEFGGFAERVNMPAAYIGPATATGSKAGPVQSIAPPKTGALMAILRRCQKRQWWQKLGSGAGLLQDVDKADKKDKASGRGNKLILLNSIKRINS